MSLSRRRFLIAGGAGAGALVTGVGSVVASRSSRSASASPGDRIDFFGPHQAGIVTPAQDRLHFAAFDVTSDDRDDLIDLLRRWTTAAAQMTAGHEVGAFGATNGPYLAPPEDTGEAIDLTASRLTITFGFGPGLFADATGRDRFGIAARRPEALRDLPHFPGDQIDPAISGGDLCVQACADDPQVAVHAVRNLARLAFGTAAVRWSQLGFGRTSSTTRGQTTPRNLMGFKDGTANVRDEDHDLVDEFVWVPQAGWLKGGTFLIARRIRMHIETWDRTSLGEQEGVIGRDKRAGAPLSGGHELTAPDFAASGSDGPLIPADAHVRLAHPSNNGGTHILRRGYNFTDGTDGVGNLAAGLFFIAFTADPDRHFIPLQLNLARHDALNEYIEHTSSAIFAVPAGASGPGDYVGRTLFES